MRSDYAERIPDPDGGIARKFRLTDTGRKLLDEERGARKVILGEVVDDWSAQDREHLAALLERLNLAVEDRSGRRWARPS